MNKIKRVITVLTVISILCTVLCIFTNAASASLSGPTTVRAGDTIKLTFKINGENTLGASFNIKFDTAMLTYSSSTSLLKNWELETNDDGSNGRMTFIFSDDKQKNPINGNENAFTVTFKVKSSVKTGASISVSANDIMLSDGNEDTSVGNATYTAKIAAPLSTDCNLSQLSLDDVELSPKFSPSETDYTAEVDHTVTSVEVTAKSNDSKAKVTVSGGDSLKTGKNTVKVTVKAENGSTKTYQIVITKKEDPNREENTDSSLKSLEPSVGILSPEFSSEITEYIIYLPFEIDSIKLDGEHNDTRGSSQDAEGELVLGKNEFKVIGTAENGDTTEYKVTVMRMPAVGETAEIPDDTDTAEITTSPESAPTEPDTTTVIPDNTLGTQDTTASEPTTTQPDNDGLSINSGVQLWVLILTAIIALLIGAGCGMLVFKR